MTYTNIRYMNAQTAGGDPYTWYGVHKTVSHNPYSTRPNAVFDCFCPTLVFYPFHRGATWFDQAVITAIADPNVKEFPCQSSGFFPVETHLTYSGLGEYPHPNNRLDYGPSMFFIRTQDIGQFDLSNYTQKGDARVGVSTSSSSFNWFKGITHSTEQWVFGDLMTQPGNKMLFDDAVRAVHPTAGPVEQTAFFFNNRAGPVPDLRTISVISTEDYVGDNGADTMTFVAYNPHTNTWHVDMDKYNFNLIGDETEYTVAKPYFDFSVMKYGDDFFDIQFTVKFLPSTGDVGFAPGKRTQGTTYYKAKFPHKGTDNTPLRYVRYHRPQQSVTATSTFHVNAPIAAQTGFTFTVCSDDFEERVILDNNTVEQQNVLLFGDRTLVDFRIPSVGSDGTVEARRLKLPGPSIEDTCQVTLPWNGELIQFDRASNQYDMAISTTDLLTYKQKLFGKNSSTTREVWSTVTPEGVGHVATLGIIARSRKFNGRFPYVQQIHTNGIF